MKRFLVCLVPFLAVLGVIGMYAGRHVHGQIQGRMATAGATVYNFRPVMFQSPCPTTSDGTNGCLVIPQTGNNPAFAIVQNLADPPGTAYTMGTAVSLATQGQVACEFDSAPQSGYTAVALNGYCHYDSAVLNDSAVCSDKSAFGRIQQLRPDLVAQMPTSYFADVNFRETAARGSMLCTSSPGIAAAVQAVQAQADWTASAGPAAILNKPTIPAGQAGITGVRYGNGSSADTAATSSQVQSIIGSGIYDASGAAAAKSAPGTCATGQYVIAATTSGPSCAQVAYSQISGTPAQSSGTVTLFSAPSASWPTWLTPAVTTATTTPSLAVTTSAIPNAALANSSMTPNGATCSLGGTCTVYPPVVCSVTITGTTTVGLLASVQQTNTTACTGVVTGGSYILVPTGAPTGGFGVLSGAFGAATAGTLTYFLYQPSVVLGTSYSIPVKVLRVQ